MGKKLEQRKKRLLADPEFLKSYEYEKYKELTADPEYVEETKFGSYAEIELFYKTDTLASWANYIKNFDYLLPERINIFSKMEELIRSGHSVSRAADISFTRYGLGSSAQANRQRWYYHNQDKRGTKL